MGHPIVGDTLYTKPLLQGSASNNGEANAVVDNVSAEASEADQGTSAVAPSSPIDLDSELASLQSSTRLLLHSEVIAFSHPSTGQECCVRAPCPF